VSFEPATEVVTRGRYSKQPVQMPSNATQARQLLRGFGIIGLQINEIGEDRIFCLTGKTLCPDGTMRRLPRTVVLEHVPAEDCDESHVRAVVLAGWIVGDRHDEPWFAPDGSLA